ncbi:hypothetical protein NCAST_11_00330 [Nocardia asteroides NBRC 15531]|uniref:Uncharacterized protein n=1 Tax=Nocardia asteroides NBRC 15531 TaxID=1110697 RepID=U5E7Z9_NOCAS|nr:hypothetical protein NCAST_11_00330 [Nocardia asteroides NBRC 15531]
MPYERAKLREFLRRVAARTHSSRPSPSQRPNLADLPRDPAPTSEEEVVAYLQRVLGTQREFDVRESAAVWVCQERADPEQERRLTRETAERASRGLPPEPAGGHRIYGVEKRNLHVFHLGQNPPDHPALLLDRTSWVTTYFGTGQIHPKPWQVRIDLVSADSRVLTYRIRAVSRADPPLQPIDHHITIDTVTNKVDYREAPLSRFLIDAVEHLTHPRYQGKPWPTTTSFDL